LIADFLILMIGTKISNHWTQINTFRSPGKKQKNPVSEARVQKSDALG